MEEVLIKYQFKKIIKKLLIDSQNDILLTNEILSYVFGKCQLCQKFVAILKCRIIFLKNKNVCTACYDRNFRYYLECMPWFTIA